MDADIRDKQLEEQAQPLAMRLFNVDCANDKQGETMNEQLTKIVASTANGRGEIVGGNNDEDIEESKDNIFKDLQRVQNDIFGSEGNDESMNMMDLNVPIEDEDVPIAD